MVSTVDCQSSKLLLHGPEKGPRLRDLLHHHLSGLLGACAGWWAARVIKMERRAARFTYHPHMSHIACHISAVTYHMSHVTCLVSPVIYIFFFYKVMELVG